MRTIAAVLAVTVLSAPATAAQKRSPVFVRLQAGLEALNGQPVAKAFEILGYPEDEKMVAGRKFYIWRNTASLRREYVVEPLECIVRLAITDQDMIDGYDYDGNAGACEAFAERFT